MLRKKLFWNRLFSYYGLQCLTKISLGGLVTLLLYLTWSRQQRKVPKERIRPEDLRLTVIHGQKPAAINPHIFVLRQQALEQYCAEVNLTAIPSPSNILFSKRLPLAYCPLSMAASTPLKYALLQAEGIKIYSTNYNNTSLKQAIHSDSQKIALRHSQQVLNGRADILLVVRDPWQRLISSYQKLVETSKSGNSFQSRYCRNLLQTQSYITFNLFLDCIIKSVDTGAKLTKSLQPIYLTCALCKLKYTKIVRFENLDNELKAAFKQAPKKLQLQTFIDSFTSCPVNRSEPYNLQPYLQHISSSTKHRIQQIYKPDFEIFGYVPF